MIESLNRARKKRKPHERDANARLLSRRNVARLGGPPFGRCTLALPGSCPVSLTTIRSKRMRLCRFSFDDMVLTGFYDDNVVIPIDQAAEAYSRDTGVELLLPSTEDLLELLPPDGCSYELARDLDAWVSGLDVIARDELTVPLEDVQLLVPIASPPKLLFLAGNYTKHVAERGGTTAERQETFPYVFMKPPSTTLTHPGDPIVIPRVSPDQIDWECELGVIIGRHCRGVPESEALRCVAGYTVVNDISDRGFKPNPGRKARERDKFFDWMHGKWHDTFCPMGPCVLSADAVPDPQTLTLKLTVNGQIKQEATHRGDDLPGGRRHLVPVSVRHARARRHHCHRNPLGRRLGNRDIPQARRPGSRDDRTDRNARESGRGGNLKKCGFGMRNREINGSIRIRAFRFRIPNSHSEFRIPHSNSAFVAGWFDDRVSQADGRQSRRDCHSRLSLGP